MTHGAGHSNPLVVDRVVRLEISSTFELLSLVDAVSEQFCRLAGLDEDSAHGLGLAVREAAANAVKHGNARDPRKYVRISYGVVTNLLPPRVIVRVSDQGPGFDERTLADPLAPENLKMTCGRGVLLMRSLMDDVSVSRTPDGGTEIVMTKTMQRTHGKD